jgi:release factor glutamine methyltransferase
VDDYIKNWLEQLCPVAEKSGTTAACLINWVLQDIGVDVDVRLLDRALLSSEQRSLLDSYLQRLLAHEPISKILQSKEFYGRMFKTTHDTLDPRYDSETVIHAALAYFSPSAAPRILDLGTGTGCLITTLLCEIPAATGIAVDICPKALAIARENAALHDVFDSITFCESNWCSQLSIEQFDCIISNPPYICDDYPLDPSVADFDPKRALFAGKDGLDAYRILFDQLPPFCKPETKIIVEIGFDQAESVPVIAFEKGFRLLETKLDTGNNPRALVFERCIKNLPDPL